MTPPTESVTPPTESVTPPTESVTPPTKRYDSYSKATQKVVIFIFLSNYLLSAGLARSVVNANYINRNYWFGMHTSGIH